jgi:hypothetical protein
VLPLPLIGKLTLEACNPIATLLASFTINFLYSLDGIVAAWYTSTSFAADTVVGGYYDFYGNSNET